MPKMLTLKQAAVETGLSYHFLRKLCINKKVYHIRSGNRYYINAESLEKYLNGETNEWLDKTTS